MNYTSNALNVMAARTFKGIGRAWLAKNLATVKTTNEIVDLLNKSIKNQQPVTLDDFERKKVLLQHLLEKNSAYIDGVTAIGDSDFPRYRGTVKPSEQPAFLFYRGDLRLLGANSNNIAVIGLLEPDAETEHFERKVVAELVTRGAVIVSGLAFGCDSIAHRQTLESGGKTVAILPSPLSNIIPAANRDLAGEIVESSGLLISEYLTEAKAKMEMTGRYQERDRLQALFSNAVVLSASYAKNDQGNDSGSRLAMGYAKDYELTRAVLYDPKTNANNPKYDLNRQIMNEQPPAIIIDSESIEVGVSQLLGLQTRTEVTAPQQISMI
ncbi:MAG: DNA-processing protein DprA [Atribacterota bacterium]|jgi:DNA processing protein|nr:DNA-processing protein DprA [Atribacterota bacterium]